MARFYLRIVPRLGLFRHFCLLVGQRKARRARNREIIRRHKTKEYKAGNKKGLVTQKGTTIMLYKLSVSHDTRYVSNIR